MQWETRLKETAILYNFMGSSKEICQFYGGSYGKILISCGFRWKGKCHGISKNGWISLVPWNLWQAWKNAQFLSWSKFLLRSAELYFLCTSVPLTHIIHSGPLPHLVVSSCEYFTLLDGCIVLWSSDDRNPWLPAKEVQRASVCGGRAWKIRNTKYSPGVFIFYGNTSLFYAI